MWQLEGTKFEHVLVWAWGSASLVNIYIYIYYTQRNAATHRFSGVEMQAVGVCGVMYVRVSVCVCVCVIVVWRTRLE